MDEINPNLSDKARQDYALVLLALQNDQKAYAELLGRYRDAIYFMLLKIVNNKSDAEDLTIEAFGKAFKSIHQYTPAFAFSTWLFKIATNNCIDYLRKIKKTGYRIEDSIDDESYDSPLQSDTLDPEEKMIYQQKVSLMHTVVEKLKPRYRQLIQMRYFEERAYEEIAEEMQLPIGTVKAQLFRARELLYNILKHKGGQI
ncbi:MAG: sigma-70 family RNA polymerase sigma factor [Bacteroidia bacterium]|nr:sigma-70 family RNA polymerase sigma factor [Bacteroidia bacterium]